MTTKIDKLQRQKKLHNNIVTDTFNLETYLTENKVTERTLRRDLHDLAENGELFDNKLSILRKICLGKLTKKAATNKISDVLMLQIVLSGVAQKIEQKIEGGETFKVEIVDNSKPNPVQAPPETT